MPRIIGQNAGKEEICIKKKRTLEIFKVSPLRIQLDIDHCILVRKLPNAKERLPEGNGGNSA